MNDEETTEVKYYSAIWSEELAVTFKESLKSATLISVTKPTVTQREARIGDITLTWQEESPPEKVTAKLESTGTE